MKRGNQAIVSRLSSASDGPGIVLFDKEAGSPGNSNASIKFQTQADDAALLRNFHCNTYWRGKQVKHLSPKIQNELTDCWRKALALASAEWVQKFHKNKI